MDNDLSDLEIRQAKGIGPGRARLFGRLGIKSIKDSLYYLPYRYEDRRALKKISDISCDHPETVRGTVISAGTKMAGRKFSVFEITVNDGTGLIKGKWFNQPFLKKTFRVGQEVVLSGPVKAQLPAGGFAIENPEYEFITGDDDSFIHTNRVVPIYRLTEGISQKNLRKIMYSIVNTYSDVISDPLPPAIIKRHNLPPLKESIRQVHFPEAESQGPFQDEVKGLYRARLVFDELFLLELGMAVNRKNNRMRKGLAFRCEGKMLHAFKNMLPFVLTSAQCKAMDDILRDMGQPHPMHRLIQGDVGCGKTVVAFMAMLYAVECGYQAALMAPTQILAEQHYSSLKVMMEKLGVRSALLGGGIKDRREDLIASGEIDIVVGTHALIQAGVKFKRLGFVVIDEQHKFGVMQRALLRKKGINPDVLVMTATPIPRSLALSMYGDLDCSVIDEMPPGRLPVITKLYHSSQKAPIYALLEQQIRKGRQAYVVYPAIEESERTDLRAAVQGKEAFQKIFPHLRVRLLHGGMKMSERELTMSAYQRGEIDILVCTTVIEVGVDVPNATVMLVVHAERFGLAQLHQLRGRVGRGAERSYCLLVAYETHGDEAGRRLGAVVKSCDGFRIAEEDLYIRGPGEFLGTRQSGMPDLKVADIIGDIKILEAAKEEAFKLVDSCPGLEAFPSLRRSVEKFWRGKVDLRKAG